MILNNYNKHINDSIKDDFRSDHPVILFSHPSTTLSFLVMALLSVFLLSGCGYHFRSGGKPEGLAIQSMAIPLMESTSSELGFESDFTNAIRSEFISHGDVPLVSRDEAEMVLIGKVYEIETTPLTYDITKTPIQDETASYEITDSRRLKIRLEARLLQRSTGRIIWADKGMEEKARYLVTKNPLTNRYNRKKALQEIARRLADRLYLKTMERF